jgi:hypothetical protein
MQKCNCLIEFTVDVVRLHFWLQSVVELKVSGFILCCHINLFTAKMYVDS